MNDLYLRHYASCEELKEKIRRNEYICPKILKNIKHYQAKSRENTAQRKEERRIERENKKNQETSKAVLKQDPELLLKLITYSAYIALQKVINGKQQEISKELEVDEDLD